MKSSLVRYAVVPLMIALSACEEPTTGPQQRPQGLEIRTSTAFFPIEKTGNGMRRTTVTGKVINDSRWTIVVNRCGYTLARLEGGTWKDVWIQSCAAVDGVPTEVLPGESLDIVVTLAESPGGLESVVFDNPSAAYCVRIPAFLKSGIPFSSTSFELEPDARLSNAFGFLLL